jgi:hypothetical protein
VSIWLVATLPLVASSAHAESAAAVPQFEVDAFWPKPLPNKWILGQVSGIATDRYDRISAVCKYAQGLALSNRHYRPHWR